MLAFFMDGTNMAISGFDKNKQDQGYAAMLECKSSQMASSHQIKRFFAKLSVVTNFIFNKILNELFVWRLHKSQPGIITLGVDTMVLDLVDFAVKITSHARHTVMKVTNTIYQTFDLEELWKRCQSPPKIQHQHA